MNSHFLFRRIQQYFNTIIILRYDDFFFLIFLNLDILVALKDVSREQYILREISTITKTDCTIFLFLCKCRKKKAPSIEELNLLDENNDKNAQFPYFCKITVTLEEKKNHVYKEVF